jgi:hypothetical protein
VVHIEGEIAFGRPEEEVFDFVADQRNEPRGNAQMRHSEKISDQGVPFGSRRARDSRRILTASGRLRCAVLTPAAGAAQSRR